MHCPFCRASDTKVIDSRLVAAGNQVRRRRECQDCNERFTTYEEAELLMPRIVKKGGVSEPFDKEKLLSGLRKALEKRPVEADQVDAMVNRIERRLQAMGEREVGSMVVGELVMEELAQADDVAYIRFASVYKRFQDINQFREEIERISHRPDATTGLPTDPD